MKVVLAGLAGVVMTTAVYSWIRPQEPPDAASLIEQMKSEDPDAAENARRDLLDLGPAALPKIREASAGDGSEAFKASLADVIVRLEVRRKAASLLRSESEQWFGVYEKDLKIGWVRMRTEGDDGKIRMDDTVVVRKDEEEEKLFSLIRCRANEYLSPVEVAVDAENFSATSGKLRVQVKGGRAVIEEDGRKKAERFPPNTVVDFAVFRLVTLLPEVKNYAVDLVDLIKRKRRPDGVLRFDRAESIEHQGRRVKTRRFVLADGETEDRVYWVDRSGKLLRAELYGTVRLERESEDSAKDLDTE